MFETVLEEAHGGPGKGELVRGGRRGGRVGRQARARGRVLSIARGKTGQDWLVAVRPDENGLVARRVGGVRAVLTRAERRVLVSGAAVVARASGGAAAQRAEREQTEDGEEGEGKRQDAEQEDEAVFGREQERGRLGGGTRDVGPDGARQRVALAEARVGARELHQLRPFCSVQLPGALTLLHQVPELQLGVAGCMRITDREQSSETHIRSDQSSKIKHMRV